jgi:hypothetical protein
MIRKSLPSGHDPSGGYQFSEKIMLNQETKSAMVIRLDPIALWDWPYISARRPLR